jgi:hypothetical protein
MEKKNFDKPDQTMTPSKAKMEVVKIAGGSISRVMYEPGWKWSTDIGPAAGADICQIHHILYVTSGRIHISMTDGEEFEIGPGEVAHILPGHDAWVVGEEPVQGFDLGGLKDFNGPAAIR